MGIIKRESTLKFYLDVYGDKLPSVVCKTLSEMTKLSDDDLDKRRSELSKSGELLVAFKDVKPSEALYRLLQVFGPPEEGGGIEASFCYFLEYKRHIFSIVDKEAMIMVYYTYHPEKNVKYPKPPRDITDQFIKTIKWIVSNQIPIYRNEKLIYV